MSSYQRIALYILFDNIESDLVFNIREFSHEENILTEDEKIKSLQRLSRREDCGYNLSDDRDLIYGLDLGEKYNVLLRYKKNMSHFQESYFLSLKTLFDKCIPIRNHIMHGRPLTINEYSIALEFAECLIKKPDIWRNLNKVYLEYSKNPESLVTKSVSFLDNHDYSIVLNNLPPVDYDDTGFVPRRDLEKDLKKKILGRHPVVTVLGEGGNGKTALTLQVLYNIANSIDHNFDAILWVSAKTSSLNVTGIKEIESVAIDSKEILKKASLLETSEGTPLERITKLLSENKILLAVDNYETVIGDEVQKLAEDVPGDSKLLFTSRLPVGGDLTVLVGEFSKDDGIKFFRRIVDAYSVNTLKNLKEERIDTLIKRLSYKPLLIKWLVLGVLSGMDPDTISLSSNEPLRFCLDNVIRKLSSEAQAVIVILSTVPVPISISVIRYISMLTSMQVNDGIAQLLRFGLIEVTTSDIGERNYVIKDFSRSFIHRIIKPKSSIIEKIISIYHGLDKLYKNRVSDQKFNPYSMRNIDISNKSQLIISERLQEAAKLAIVHQEYDEAEKIIQRLKLEDAGYYEIHRVEGYIAQQQNDFSRAKMAYDTAISLSPESPQLYFFCGALLLRLSENEEAAKYFDKAFEIDNESSIVLREMARNYMIMDDFDKAEIHIEKSRKLVAISDRDINIINDIHAQLILKKLDRKLRSGKISECENVIDEITSFLNEIDSNIIDSRLGFHIKKFLPLLGSINEEVSFDKKIHEIVNMINKIAP